MPYSESCATEATGISELEPFFRLLAARFGMVSLTNDGKNARVIQLTRGDIVAGGGKYVEVKCEERYTGNFFLETWSNATFDFSNPGWMYHLKSDYLAYYFRDTKQLYVVDFQSLWDWFFWKRYPGGGKLAGSRQRFPEVIQGKCEQKNRTVGCIVGIEIVRREVPGFREYRIVDESTIEMVFPRKEMWSRGSNCLLEAKRTDGPSGGMASNEPCCNEENCHVDAD